MQHSRFQLRRARRWLADCASVGRTSTWPSQPRAKRSERCRRLLIGYKQRDVTRSPYTYPTYKGRRTRPPFCSYCAPVSETARPPQPSPARRLPPSPVRLTRHSWEMGRELICKAARLHLRSAGLRQAHMNVIGPSRKSTMRSPLLAGFVLRSSAWATGRAQLVAMPES